MYLVAAIKMAVCLVEIIDDDVSQNHCVSNCSSTKTVASSNLSQHILTRIVDLGAVLLTFSCHSDSKMGHVINYLLTECSCRTRKYKPLVFQTALASSGCMKNLRLVFPGTALSPS